MKYSLKTIFFTYMHFFLFSDCWRRSHCHQPQEDPNCCWQEGLQLFVVEGKSNRQRYWSYCCALACQEERLGNYGLPQVWWDWGYFYCRSCCWTFHWTSKQTCHHNIIKIRYNLGNHVLNIYLYNLIRSKLALHAVPSVWLSTTKSSASKRNWAPLPNTPERTSASQFKKYTKKFGHNGK